MIGDADPYPVLTWNVQNGKSKVRFAYAPQRHLQTCSKFSLLEIRFMCAGYHAFLDRLRAMLRSVRGLCVAESSRRIRWARPGRRSVTRRGDLASALSSRTNWLAATSICSTFRKFLTRNKGTVSPIRKGTSCHRYWATWTRVTVAREKRGMRGMSQTLGEGRRIRKDKLQVGPWVK